MGAIKIQANGSKALAKIKALEDSAGNMQPVYETIGRVLVNRIRLGFKLGIDPFGSPWAALKFRKGQPLRDKGLLQRSIVARPDSTGVTVGTNLIQAPVHQFGAVIKPKNAKRLVFPGPNGGLVFAKKVTIPARPFLPLRKDAQVVALPPAWSSDVVRALRLYFKREIEKEAV